MTRFINFKEAREFKIVKKMTNETNIMWEEALNLFIFNDEIPGKIKMHTRKLDLNNWVKIDKTYPAQMKLKAELQKTHRDEVFVSNYDDSAVACKWELFDLLAEHLPKRFPDIFELRQGCIYNKVLNLSVSTEREDPEDPLIRAGNLTQEDWVIIEWNEEEQGYVLTSGIVYFPMRWSLQDKFNKPISSIHTPVKPFMEHLVTKVYDVFKKMIPDAPIWRGNWAVFNDLEGPLDLFTPSGSLDRNEVNTPTKYEGEKTGRVLTFRAEYQTLRKLPKTKCIVFSIRTYQRYLEDFHNFPNSDCEGLIKAIENLDEEFTIYKGANFWKDAAVTYLRHIIQSREEKSALNKRLTSRSWFLPVTLLFCAVITGFAVNRFMKLR